MPRGRPAKGPKLVEGLEGSDEAKKRLEVVLETIAGKIGIDEACETLDIGKTAFHKLRARVLQSALIDLEPKPLGRPRHEVATRRDSSDPRPGWTSWRRKPRGCDCNLKSLTCAKRSC